MPVHWIDVPALRIDSGYAASYFKTPVTLGAAFQIEFWFRPTSIPNPGFVPILLFDSRPRPNSQYIWIGLLNGQLTFGCYPGGGYSGQSFALEEKRWWHISAVYSNRGQTIEAMAYSRGRPAARSTLQHEGQPLDANVVTDVSQIGGGFTTHLPTQTLGTFTNGAYADLRLWSTARNTKDTEVGRESRLVGNESGLAGYWMFDEAEGTVFYDSSPNGNDGERIVRAFEWERQSGLELGIGSVEGDRKDHLATKQVDHLDAMRNARQHELDAHAPRRAAVEAELRDLEKLRQDTEQSIAEQTRDSEEELERKQKELEDERGEIVRAEEEEMKKKSASNTIRLGAFITHVQEDMRVSRENIRSRYGRLYGLDTLSMDVRMIPGFGGVGLHLPDPNKVSDAARLSTLTLEFKAKREEQEAKPESAWVPNLEGTTELFARRKLTEAGFKVDSVYQVVDDKSPENGRVIKQIYTQTEDGKAELGSVIGLVIGRSR